MGRAFGVCQDYPGIAPSIRSYNSGVKDLRAAVDKYVPGGRKGDSYELNLAHAKIMDIIIKAWRKYQNYVRCRNDIGAVARHAAELDAWNAAHAQEPIAQSPSDA